MTGGSIKSEPGFSPAVDAQFVSQGADYIHNDPDGKFMRLGQCFYHSLSNTSLEHMSDM